MEKNEIEIKNLLGNKPGDAIKKYRITDGTGLVMSIEDKTVRNQGHTMYHEITAEYILNETSAGKTNITVPFLGYSPKKYSDNLNEDIRPQVMECLDSIINKKSSPLDLKDTANNLNQFYEDGSMELKILSDVYSGEF